ncbi:DMT family transporter [Nocardioides bruguierae]|uniref:DMT family transporter n=1 Tax=Nocardioides bruguierae TaxID=2945102 RepID=UPI00202137A6|nr:SMR family transporter [Nocardioides bruguierae]MCL8025364.1 SMR family transporter [Nocardioides bruguierae]
MTAWLLLAGAIGCEVAGTVGLRMAADDALSARGRVAWLTWVALAYTAAFALLAATLRAGLPLGVAYGTWAAVGVVLTALLGRVLFAERLTPRMLVGFALVVGGVLLVELGAH